LSSVAINKDADSLAGSAVRKRGMMYNRLAECLSLAHSWHTDFHARRGKLQIPTDWQSVDRPVGPNADTAGSRPVNNRKRIYQDLARIG
jgi:hypothetical protein